MYLNSPYGQSGPLSAMAGVIKITETGPEQVLGELRLLNTDAGNQAMRLMAEGMVPVTAGQGTLHKIEGQEAWEVRDYQLEAFFLASWTEGAPQPT